MISQSSTFFDGTIESNLRRARPNISEREFSDALNWSGLRGILDELEDGLSTEIDQYASGMSSSHKIIISLARAIISNPKVILFNDDAFWDGSKPGFEHIMKLCDLIIEGKVNEEINKDIIFNCQTKVGDFVIKENGKRVLHDELLKKLITVNILNA